MDYSQQELCSLALAIEEFFQQDNRAINAYGLDRDSRPHMYHHFFSKVISEEDLKIPEHFFNMCSQCVRATERGEQYNKSINPLPKILQLIYIFGEHESTKLPGFIDWLSSFKRGKYKPLIERALDAEIQSIASSADLQGKMDELLDQMARLVVKVDGQENVLKRFEARNEMLNKKFHELYEIAKKVGDPKVIAAFKKSEKDFSE